jgi:hypothetical protein
MEVAVFDDKKPPYTPVGVERCLHDLVPREFSRLFCVVPDRHTPLYMRKQVFVSTLLDSYYGCRRKVWYQYNEKIAVPLSSIYVRARGIAFHNMIDMPYKEFEVMYEAQLKEEIRKKYGIQSDLFVVGYPDGYDAASGTLVDLKTTMSPPLNFEILKRFNKRDLLQVQLYHTMMDWMKFPVKRVRLLYFDMENYYIYDSEDHEELNVTFNPETMGYMIASGIIVARAAKESDVQIGPYNKEPPYDKMGPDWWQYRCRFCEYRRYCKEGTANVRNYINKIYAKYKKASTFLKNFSKIKPSGFKIGDKYIDPIDEMLVEGTPEITNMDMIRSIVTGISQVPQLTEEEASEITFEP